MKVSRLRKRLGRILNFLKKPLIKSIRRNENVGTDHHGSQVALKMIWRNMRDCAPEKRPKFSEVGFRCFSQFEEDGILLYIFSVIGEKSKIVVEMCAGSGNECMATNLIVNHNWQGFLFDGNKKMVQDGQLFFNSPRSTFFHPPVFTHAWITAENVNELIRDAMKLKPEQTEVDLLSLDIDGMDYWIWKSLDIISPRVVIMETNCLIPYDMPLTVKYAPESTYKHGDVYIGASIAAMVKLSREKGYRLIGAHRHGFNAIFMRDDVGLKYFPEVTAESLHYNSEIRHAQATRWLSAKSLPWVEV